MSCRSCRQEFLSAGVPVGIVDTDGGGVVEGVVFGRLSCRHYCRQSVLCRPCGRFCGPCCPCGQERALSFLWAFLWAWRALCSALWSAGCPVVLSAGKSVCRHSCRHWSPCRHSCRAERPVWPLWPCGGSCRHYGRQESLSSSLSPLESLSAECPVCHD